jgi:hypothetical protein
LYPLGSGINPSEHKLRPCDKARKQWRTGIKDNALRERSASARYQRGTSDTTVWPENHGETPALAELIGDFARDFLNSAAKQNDIVRRVLPISRASRRLYVGDGADLMIDQG